MQSIRSATRLRGTWALQSRPLVCASLSRRRGFADEKPGDISKTDTTRSAPTGPGGASTRIPLALIGGVIFMMVAGRYILASDKPAASGHAEIKAARREHGTSEEYRDPRDSGVKTLEQKKKREGS